MKIREIQIRNFRSIRNILLPVNNFNSLVGLNDVGKSNILRALNLFFNDQTENGHAFDFDLDFSYHFPSRSKRTKEITILIKFDVPSSFKEHGLITWQRAWRKTGALEDQFLNESNAPLPSTSRVPLALKRLRYRYVPAVRSRDYYRELLVELYHTLSESLSVPLQKSTEDFASSIKGSTDELTQSLLSSLGIQSILTVPNNLQEFFKSLVFETKADSDEITVSLEQRGDGIQARHIPQILKFIAKEDQNSRTKGAPRIYTIWGYEEPENGLELSMAFQMAHEFSEISEQIQVFVTTHSPAFYIEADQCKSGTLAYIKKDSTGETKVVSKTDPHFLNNELGLMPLIAPYLQEKICELEHYASLVKTNFLTDCPTIAVEGVTDKRYLEKAISILSPDLQCMLDQHRLRILVNPEAGGTNQIVNWGLAWIHAGFSSKIFFILDNDSAGKAAKASLLSNEKVTQKISDRKMKILHLSLPSFYKQLAQRHIIMPTTIESLFIPNLWPIAEANNWLEPRSNRNLKDLLSNALPLDQSVSEFLRDICTDLSIPSTYVTHQVRDQSKTAFCNAIIALSDNDPCIFNCLNDLIYQIHSFFS